MAKVQGTAVAEPAEPDELVESDEGGDAFAKFAQLAQAIGAAGKSKKERTARLDEVLQLAASLSDEEKQELGKVPAIRQLVDAALEADRPVRGQDPPGTIRGILKKYWTERDLQNMPLRTVLSPIKATLIWNGLRRDIPAMEPAVVPEVFEALLLDHLRNVKISEQHAAWLFQHRGVRPDDTTVVGPTSAMVRATGEVGEKQHFQPGGGLIAGLRVTEDIAPEGEGDGSAA